MTTPFWMTGFEYGLATLTANGTGLCDVIAGTVGVQSTYKRLDNYALRVNPSPAATSYIQRSITGTMLVGRVYFMYHAWPSLNCSIVLGRTSSAYGYININATTHKIFAAFNNPQADQGNALSLDTWYRLDFRMDISNNPNTIEYQLDGTAYSHSEAIAAQTFNAIRIGNYESVTNDCCYDDVLISVTSADYPIGAGRIVGLSPASDGTHNAGTNVIEDNAGTDIGATPAYNKINSVPIGDTTTYIRQAANSTTNYFEVAFATMPSGTPKGAAALLAYRAATSTADEGACIIIDEDATQTTVWGNPTTRADYSESSVFYKSVILPTPAGGWDKAAVDALRARGGYSNDTNPNPWWVDMMVEVDYSASGATPQACSGAVSTIAGVTVKRANKGTDGTLIAANIVGAAVRRANKSTAGTLIAANIVGATVKRANKSTAGTLIAANVAGATVKRANKSTAGAVATITGGLVRKALKLATGAVATITGALIKRARFEVEGEVTSIHGVLTTLKTKVQAVSGAVATIVGALQKRTNKLASGSGGTPPGGLARRVSKAASGAVATITGVLTTLKTKVQAVSGAVATITGTLVKRDNKTTSGSGGTPVGGLVRRGNKSASGAVATITGALVKVRLKLLSGAVDTISGAIQNQINKSLAGALTPAGGVLKQIAKIVGGAVATITGALAAVKVALVNLPGATVGSAGGIIKLVYKYLWEWVYPLPRIDAGYWTWMNLTVIKNAAGGSASSGVLSKQIGKSMLGAVSGVAGLLARTTIKLAGGTVAGVGDILKLVYFHLWEWVYPLPLIDAGYQTWLTKTVLIRQVGAVDVITGAVAKTVLIVLVGLADAAGAAVRTALKRAVGSVDSTGAISKFVFATLSRVAASWGWLWKQVATTGAGVASASGGLVRRWRNAGQFISGLLGRYGVTRSLRGIYPTAVRGLRGIYNTLRSREGNK